MPNKRFIVIPLWDHTPDSEIRDMLDALDCHGFLDTDVIEADSHVIESASLARFNGEGE